MIPAIIFAVLVASLILGVPIAVALGLAGAAGVVVLYGGLSGGAAILSQSIYDTISNFIISAIPLYLLMAYLLLHSGMVGDLFRLGERVLARIPGGLVVASVITSAIFAAASASSSATVATVGGVALPEMLQRGYDRKLSAGALAVSGTLGILIPPSAVLILYGFVTETSVGALFAAGIAPGIMLVVLMSTYVIVKQLHANRAGNAPSAVKASRELVGTAAHQAGSGALAARGGDPGRGSRADPGGGPVPGALGPTMDTDVDHAKAGPKKEWQANLGALGAVLVIPLVLGSIYSGVASPTEAAGIGIVYGLVVSVIRRRLNVRKLWNALGDAAQYGAMILAIIAGAGVFAKAATLAGIPQATAAFLGASGVNKIGFVVLTVVLFLVLGTFLDASAVVLAVIPILLPVVTLLHIDPIWFGIVTVMSMEIGAVTPPLGVNIFVLKGIRPDFSVGEIVRGAATFLVCTLVGLILVIAVPAIALAPASWLTG